MSNKDKIQNILDTQLGTSGLELIETTASLRDAAVETDWAVIGFDTYEQATEFAERNEMKLLWVDKYWSNKRWHRGDDYVRPMTIGMENFGENHFGEFVALADINEHYADVLKDSLEDEGSLEDAERIVKQWRTCYDKLDRGGEDKVVITYDDDFYGIYDLHPTAFDGDTRSIALAATFLDEEDDGDNDELLPENVVQRCKYMGQPLDTTELCYSNVELNESLKVPVTHIRMDYPFRIEGGGSYNVYEIVSAKTWGELLTETIKVFQREYKADKAVAPHQLSDYIIELVDVHPNGLATIVIGS